MSQETGIRYGRLIYRSLPELLSFQLMSSLVFSLPASLLTGFMSRLLSGYDTSITSANIRTFFSSWRAPVIILLSLLTLLWFFVIELLVPVLVSYDILSGRRSRVLRRAVDGIKALKQFGSLRGVGSILFIFIAVPLCGVGISVSLTEDLYVPNFIKEVIDASPLYSTAYTVLMILFAVMLSVYRFSLQAVLLDGQSVREADRTSARIMKEHRKEVWRITLRFWLTVAVAACLFFYFVTVRPEMKLSADDPGTPNVLEAGSAGIFSLTSLSDKDQDLIFYRIRCASHIIMSNFLNSVAGSLLMFLISLTRTMIYLRCTRDTGDRYPERPRRLRLLRTLILALLLPALLLFWSVYTGIYYESVYGREIAGVIAHRTGGTMASENSVEGLELSIAQGCFGAETDVQRTSDGRYIINHDGTFRRLTGVNRKPEEMTFDEVMQLRIRDTTGSGKELTVPTIEELLDASKGRIKLFIELKGATADRRMVDDLVSMIRERDCVDDVVLISLDYDLMAYAETNYPEFETGTLFFLGLGDISNLNCDLIMMEEESVTEERLRRIHDSGRKAAVWTVNKEEALYKFLDSGIDYVITDEVILAGKVTEKLSSRSVYREMVDRIGR